MQGLKFNQEGITAILEDRKTMTRRPIEVNVVSIDSDGFVYWMASNNNDYMDNMEEFIRCFSKYKIGETVFVQEEFNRFVSSKEVIYKADARSEYAVILYERASEMTEKEARIFLKITGIKAERLQDISEEDCVKEGAEVACMGCDELYPNCKCASPDYDNAKDLFRYDIWNKLPYQPPYDWNSNPYVFVYEFERVENV